MKKIVCVLMCALALHGATAFAALSLNGTRIVYPAKSRFADITAENAGSEPSQMLAWVDDGDVASTPDTASAPFLLIPAVSVVRPGRKQTLRIVYNGSALPQDREAVYYLNVVELPPKSSGARAAPEMKVAVRTRIKIFMRPADLALEPLAAAKKLAWSVDTPADGPAVFRAKNASPYFVSMASVKLTRRGAETADLGAGMVPPWGELELRPQVQLQPADLADCTVQYIYVNDHGGGEEISAALPAR